MIKNVSPDEVFSRIIPEVKIHRANQCLQSISEEIDTVAVHTLVPFYHLLQPQLPSYLVQRLALYDLRPGRGQKALLLIRVSGIKLVADNRLNYCVAEPTSCSYNEKGSRRKVVKSLTLFNTMFILLLKLLNYNARIVSTKSERV